MTQPLTWIRHLRDHPAATGSRLAVLCMLAARMNGDTGAGFCSHATAAADAGYSADTVKRAINWAMENGYLRRTTRGHRLGNGAARASEYQLTYPQAQAQQCTDAPLRESQQCRTPTSTVQTAVPNSAPVHPQGVDLQEVITRGTRPATPSRPAPVHCAICGRTENPCRKVAAMTNDRHSFTEPA